MKIEIRIAEDGSYFHFPIVEKMSEHEKDEAWIEVRCVDMLLVVIPCFMFTNKTFAAWHLINPISNNDKEFIKARMYGVYYGYDDVTPIEDIKRSRKRYAIWEHNNVP